MEWEIKVQFSTVAAHRSYKFMLVNLCKKVLQNWSQMLSFSEKLGHLPRPSAIPSAADDLPLDIFGGWHLSISPKNYPPKFYNARSFVNSPKLLNWILWIIWWCVFYVNQIEISVINLFIIMLVSLWNFHTSFAMWKPWSLIWQNDWVRQRFGMMSEKMIRF